MAAYHHHPACFIKLISRNPERQCRPCPASSHFLLSLCCLPLSSYVLFTHTHTMISITARIFRIVFAVLFVGLFPVDSVKGGPAWELDKIINCLPLDVHYHFRLLRLHPPPLLLLLLLLRFYHPTRHTLFSRKARACSFRSHSSAPFVFFFFFFSLYLPLPGHHLVFRPFFTRLYHPSFSSFGACCSPVIGLTGQSVARSSSLSFKLIFINLRLLLASSTRVIIRRTVTLFDL